METTSPTTDQATATAAVAVPATLTLALAQASIAAYNDFANKPVVPPVGYRLVGRFTGWNGLFSSTSDWGGWEEKYGLVFASLIYGPSNQLIVAFRGTDSLSDLYEDGFFDFANFLPYCAQGANPTNPLAEPVNVSSGFNSVYTGIGGTMTKSMQQQLFSMVPLSGGMVYITGHSLGGALSQLFTLDMAASRPKVPIQTINFASPQVGDSTWQQACNQVGATGKITRVINNWDFVPDYPSDVEGFYSYVSVGQQFVTSFVSVYDYDFSILSNHSISNLYTVLQNGLYRTPQGWTGTFYSVYDNVFGYKVLMQSTAVQVSAEVRAQWKAKLKEAFALMRPQPAQFAADMAAQEQREHPA